MLPLYMLVPAGFMNYSLMFLQRDPNYLVVFSVWVVLGVFLFLVGWVGWLVCLIWVAVFWVFCFVCVCVFFFLNYLFLPLFRCSVGWIV